MHWELALEVALVLAIGVAVFIATRPSLREITESVSIQAREVAVFEVATDFHRWNPWAGWDPNVTSRYVGHAAREGAGLHWESTGNAGSGRLIITDVEGSKRVTYLLEEQSPSQSLQVTALALFQKEETTTVSWGFSRKLSYFEKAAAFFGVFEPSVRRKLQRGLASLKARVEAEAKDPSSRPPSLVACSFCGKTQREVRKLISGPSVAICDECIKLCNDIIAEEIEKESRSAPA